MDSIHLYDKILSPLLTEKTTNLSSQNKIVFKVRKNANKKNLKKNIEKIFKVNVTKINIIKNLIPKLDNIIIVGGMANNILKYKGHNIGKSIQEDNCDQIIKEILYQSKKFIFTKTNFLRVDWDNEFNRATMWY